MREQQKHVRGHRKASLQMKINESNFDRKLVSELEFSWNFLGARSGTAHLKEHLIRTILSDGSPKILKALGRDNPKVGKLIQRMEQANRKTLGV